MHLSKTGRLILSCLLALTSVVAIETMTDAQTSSTTQPADQAAQKNQQAPRPSAKQSLSVYWVGHSLIEAQAQTAGGPITLMSLMGTFSKSQGLTYTMGDHTLWGAPLSALWRGKPHGYDRDASAMAVKRQTFERTAAQYDTLVLTEALPLRDAIQYEYSSYYLRKFYCVVKKANPAARVYLYETWANFQGADKNANYPPAHKFNWREEMTSQRIVWEQLADAAQKPSVKSPGWLSSFGINSTTDAQCDTQDPIFIVPVGSTFQAIAERLENKTPQDNFQKPDGDELKLADLFANPYINWPSQWPLKDSAQKIDPSAQLAELKLADPKKPHDDIHPSAVGIYVATLVHYATLTARSPVGLPTPEYIGDDLGRTLQCITWQTVTKDPRSGVAGTPTC